MMTALTNAIFTTMITAPKAVAFSLDPFTLSDSTALPDLPRAFHRQRLVLSAERNTPTSTKGPHQTGTVDPLHAYRKKDRPRAG